MPPSQPVHETYGNYGGKYTFPVNESTDLSGIDSFMEGYAAEGIELSFDFGLYAKDFGEWPNETKYEDARVNGKAARFGTVKREFHEGFPYSTQIRVKLTGHVALSMFAVCKSEKEVAIARKIFETIKFKVEK